MTRSKTHDTHANLLSGHNSEGNVANWLEDKPRYLCEKQSNVQSAREQERKVKRVRGDSSFTRYNTSSFQLLTQLSVVYLPITVTCC